MVTFVEEKVKDLLSKNFNVKQIINKLKLSLSVQLELGTSWANQIEAGWWMTILWTIGDHPFDGVWPAWNYLAIEELTYQILASSYD